MGLLCVRAIEPKNVKMTNPEKMDVKQLTAEVIMQSLQVEGLQ